LDLTRQELDARNSEQRKRSFFETAADKFNYHSFNPTSLILPDLHADFGKSYDLSTGKVPTPITPDQVRQKFNEAKAKLTAVRGSMYKIDVAYAVVDSKLT
jgi:hypothetical protein